MSDKPFWQQRRDQKLGKPSPAPGKQAKSTDQPPEKNPKPKKKGMRKVSKKRAKEERQYRPVRKKFLQDHPTCQLNLPGCQGAATQIHHSAGRENSRLLNIDDFKSACDNCHKIVTEKSRQAIADGHSKSRLGKPNKNPLA